MINASADNIFVKDKNGDWEINTGLNVEVNRINTVFEYITQGLFYLEMNYRLPDQYHVVSTFGREDDSREGNTAIENFKKSLKNRPWKDIGDEKVFMYRFSTSIEKTPQSIWEMKIYKGKSTISLIANKNINL